MSRTVFIALRLKADHPWTYGHAALCDIATHIEAEVSHVEQATAYASLADLVADATPDLSGGDPGYRLIARDGPVILTLETANGIERKAAFATIADAAAYLGCSTTIDKADLQAGRYGIDAPCGAGSDEEAVDHARARGFQLFWAVGSACWANSHVAISGNLTGRGWHTGFRSIEAAAHAALASVDPD